MDNKEFKAARLRAFDGMEVAANVYNLVIGGVLLWGIAINILMAQFFMKPILEMNYLAVIIIYFVGSFASMFAVYRSNSPVISFIGFTGLSVSMGLLLTYYVSYFEIGSIAMAFITTAVVTGAMMVAATIFPTFFKGIGRVLFFSLLITIIAEIVISLIMGIGATIFDFIVVIIFCGYIGYDWAKAQEYPNTVDNAIDSAADIYVDVVNLFVRILSIIGKKK